MRPLTVVRAAAFVPLLVGYVLLGVLFDILREIAKVVWDHELYLVPAKYRNKELEFVLWISRWPSLPATGSWINRVLGRTNE